MDSCVVVGVVEGVPECEVASLSTNWIKLLELQSMFPPKYCHIQTESESAAAVW